jgi:hypothetical protein
MSFTSHIVPIGEGWDPVHPVEDAANKIYTVHNDGAATVGAEGSSDDSEELFPDTFVDLANNANKKMIEREKKQKRSLFYWLKRKKESEE